jgi:hypothetical protein
MKTIFKIAIICGLIISTIYSCERKNLYGYVEGSITGTFLCPKTVNGHPSDTIRGFCILLRDRENSTITYFPMDLYTFHLPDGYFPFPSEIYNYKYSGSNCGPKFFPDSLVSNYKIMFKYRYPDENEIIEFVCGPCFAMEPTFPWRHYKQITVEDIAIGLEK